MSFGINVGLTLLQVILLISGAADILKVTCWSHRETLCRVCMFSMCLCVTLMAVLLSRKSSEAKTKNDWLREMTNQIVEKADSSD